MLEELISKEPEDINEEFDLLDDMDDDYYEHEGNYFKV